MPSPAAVFRVYAPGPELRPYVCSYMWFTVEGDEPERTFIRVLHDGSQESRFNSADPLLTCMPPAAFQCITFNFGDPWRIRNGSRKALTPKTSWAAGATTQPGTFDFPRRAETLDVVFRPGVAQVFLRVPADSLTDQITALDDLWGPAARALTAQLAELPSLSQKIRVLEKELLRRLRSARWTDVSLQRITNLIERERGAVSVEWLSQASGLSRQYLARKFKQHVGVSPKQFCRFTRFHALLTRVVLNPSVDWAAIAAEFGYYDQAHLIGEFKEFTGLTPSRFLQPPSVVSAQAAD